MYKFINFPKSIPLNEYNKEIESFSKFIQGLFIGNNFSLYLIGELSLPGVSDLDFIVIADDLSKNNDILNNIKNYNLIDKPLFLKYSDINNLEYFTHHCNFKYVSGKKIDNELFEKKNKNLFLIYSWKILFFSGLRNFYIPYYQKKIDIKKMLNWLNDIRYPIFYISKITNLDKNIINLNNEYENFRNNWFEYQDTEKIVYFLEKFINISWDLIFILSKELKYVQGVNENIYGRFPTIFKKNLDLEFCKNKTENYFKKISKIDRFLVLPYSLNYKNWENSLKNDLILINSLNKYFFNFGFNSFILSILLIIKKIIDFIKIKIFEKYEKV